MVLCIRKNKYSLRWVKPINPLWPVHKVCFCGRSLYLENWKKFPQWRITVSFLSQHHHQCHLHNVIMESLCYVFLMFCYSYNNQKEKKMEDRNRFSCAWKDIGQTDLSPLDFRVHDFFGEFRDIKFHMILRLMHSYSCSNIWQT